MKQKNYNLFICLILLFSFQVDAQQIKQAVQPELQSFSNNQVQVSFSKQKPKQNKSTLIWGAGSTNGAAVGEFQNPFNTSGAWTATSFSDGNGSPGNALWVRSTTGVSQGAYWGTRTPIASQTVSNGVALFDSDYLDNGGIAGNFGNGSSASPHHGILVSPTIDLTGYTDTAIAVSFYCKWRNFNVNTLSISLSVDGGTTYTDMSISAVLPAAANVDNEGYVTLAFPNITQGVANLSNCNLKLTFNGDYYFAMIDDVSISVASNFDLTIQKADANGASLADANEVFQIGNNAVNLLSQIRPEDMLYAANVKNLGVKNVVPSDNAFLNVDIQKLNGASWTSVYQDSKLIDSIDISSNGRVVLDSISNQSWLSVGDYRAVYYTTVSGESDRSNDTLIQSFSISDDYMSKVDQDNLGRPFYDRPIFPGGTNFNLFEFGSYFTTPTGASEYLSIDSVSYVYYTPGTYTGSGSQNLTIKIYEWNDGANAGSADGLPDELSNGEHTLVAAAVDNLTGLTASASYTHRKVAIADVNTLQPSYQLQDGKIYFISVAVSGTQFTSTSSVWLGASEAKSYALNYSNQSPLVSSTQIFMEDGSGVASDFWLGFGADIVPSIAAHLKATPPQSNLVITEIMYNPPESGTDSLEYIEIYNPDTVAVNMDGFFFTQGVNHTFNGVSIAPKGFVVASVDSTAMRNVFGIPSIQWTSGGLSNGGEDIALHDNFNRRIDSVNYDDGSPWPSGGGNGQPDGGGSSIELISPSLDNNNGANWMASLAGTGVFINGLEVKGSPGFFPVNLMISGTNVSCNGGNDGSATATASSGTPPYSYLWSTGATTSSISSLVAGTYALTVTDNSGSSTVESITITEPTALVPLVQVDSNVSCNGISDGGATASATGGTAPYTYLWSNSATTASITGVMAGTYAVTITDNNGCTASNSASITEPANLITSTTIDSTVSCNGLSDGGATGSATGGTAPYTYLWSNSATTSSITGVMAGTYTVTITDNNGCTNSSSAVISQPTLLNATATSTDVSCNGGNDGTATASGSGGTSPYTYLWSNGATSATANNMVAGTYSVTLSDANGCTDLASVTINNPALLTQNINIVSASCNGSNDGSISITSSGGTPPYTYNWSTGATTASLNNLAAGTYTVTITDANGCTDVNFNTITQPSAINVNANVTDVSCNGLNDGSISLNTSGGTSPYTYSWSGGLTGANPVNLIAGTYNVTVTDANGCTAVSSNTVNQPTAIVTTVSRVNVTLTADQSGAAYRWLDCNNGNSAISGETGQSFTATANGDYAVEITLNSCVDTSSCISIISVGFEEFEKNQLNYSLYPNPGNGLFNIQIEGTKLVNERLRVFDMSGKVVRDMQVSGNLIQLELSDLNSGIYFVDLAGLRKKIVLTE